MDSTSPLVAALRGTQRGNIPGTLLLQLLHAELS
jgi:hypothetical protein